jgi:mannose-1-phosphate guanylyltransferase
LPQKPETGYGYIERKGDVISFRKKTSSFSRDFIAKGNFLWNSGCFVLRLEFIGRIKAFILYIEKSKLVWENNVKGNLDLAYHWIFLPSVLIMRWNKQEKIKKGYL